MSEPSSGFVALIAAFLLADTGAGAAVAKPQPDPVHVLGSPVCSMEIVTKDGRHDFTAKVTAPDKKVSGRYVLTLDGLGKSTVKVRDERKLALDPGETEVLSTLDLDADLKLSGRIEFRDSKGAVLCQGSL